LTANIFTFAFAKNILANFEQNTKESINFYIFNKNFMIKKFIRWFVHFSMRGRNVLLFLGLYIMMAALVMSEGATQIKKLSGKDLDPLDLFFSYSPAIVYPLLEEYGENGRAFYALFEMTADAVYPIIYTLLFCSLIGYAWKSFILKKFQLALLIFTPFLVLVFDYAENTCIVVLLKNYPTQIDWLVNLSSIFTSSKWISLALCVLVLLAGLGKKGLDLLNTRSKT